VGDFFNTILSPLTVGEAWVMLAWHKLWTLLGIGGGWAWALSIVGLTVVVRIVLIPLFVKQIHASRKMQLIQPEIQKIQAKYKGKTDPESRQAMTQETMDLYKKSGTNPLSSCLPILLQSPFFFALFTVLNNLKGIAEGKHAPIGPITPEIAQQIETSNIFGAPFSSSFMNSTDLATKIVTVVLIVLMSATTFTTQRQLMRKNLPASAMDNPYMKQQNIILYLMPLFFALSGINFPIGVLLYWLTTNLWSMGQQFYVIRRMPAPGSEAERALHERQARKGKLVTPFSIPGFDRDGKGAADGDGAAGAGSGAGSGAGADGAGVSDAPVTRQRQQPKSAKRAKKTAAPKPPAAGGSQDSGPGGPGDPGGPASPAGPTAGPKGTGKA